MTHIEADGTNPRERGWALVSVLWVVSILAMMAAATEALTVTSARIEHLVLTQARIEAAMDAGTIRAIVGITAPDLEKRWPVDGAAQNFAFAGYPMRVSVQDELGRIDLNVADESLLRRLLSDAGLNTEDAAALTDKILDWRSATKLHRLHGATDADYAAAGYAYHQRHGPFQTVDELKLVMGMTPSLFEKIRPALTVYTRRPSIDPNVAPREALLVYYGGNVETVDRALEARQTNDRASFGQPGSARPGVLGTGISLAGRVFTVIVKLENGKQHFERDAAIEFTGDDQRPYLVLTWR